MILAEYIVYSIIALYALIIFLFIFGWFRIKTFNDSTLIEDINVSIVIAFRNESKNISKLIDSLAKQTYNKEKTEIIFIDDHSDDNTSQIIKNYIEEYNFITLLNLPHNKTGKKEALAYGINNSKSKIIISTDADCTMSKDWVKTLVSFYILYKPKLIVGPVTFKNEKKLFSKLQNLEFLSLIGSGAGAIGINRAIMNNGANLLFEKSAFEESNLMKKYISGDDIFLMLHIKKTNKNAIQFIKSRNAIVYTEAARTIPDVFNQRIRWASKSKAYRDFDIIYTAITVAITNLVFVFGYAYSIFNFHFFKTILCVFILKSIFDLSILIPVSRFFKQQNLLWLFFPLQIIYPFYIIITVIFGLFGKFNWKGRIFKEKG